jgi:hypothetical protein
VTRLARADAAAAARQVKPLTRFLELLRTTAHDLGAHRRGTWASDPPNARLQRKERKDPTRCLVRALPAHRNLLRFEDTGDCVDDEHVVDVFRRGSSRSRCGTQHRLTRNMFDAWLRRTGGSPADVARKSRLKGLLGDVA